MSEVRKKLITIATQTIQKSGIDALTMRELGEAVGIKASSVMYHFKNKNGLIHELVEIYNHSFFQHLKELTRLHSNKKVRLDKFVDVFENVLKEDKFCLCGMLASESDSLDAPSQESTRNFFEVTEAWISSNLEENKNADAMAKVIISSLEGAMLLDKLDQKLERIHAVRVWIKSL